MIEAAAASPNQIKCSAVPGLFAAELKRCSVVVSRSEQLRFSLQSCTVQKAQANE